MRGVKNTVRKTKPALRQYRSFEKLAGIFENGCGIAT